MKLSLSKRIIGAVIFAVIIGSAAALVSSVILMRAFNEQAQKDVEQFATAVQGQLDAIKDKCREAAYQFAVRPDVAEAVKKGDTLFLNDGYIQIERSGALADIDFQLTFGGLSNEREEEGGNSCRGYRRDQHPSGTYGIRKRTLRLS